MNSLLILFALILLNGVFAMSEIALLTARRARLAQRAKEGDRAAQCAIDLGREPTVFLSTIQIGITSIGILNGIVGEAALAKPVSIWLESLGVPPESSSIGATVLVVVVITYVSIVIGELVPKRIGQLHPERMARLVARPMRVLAVISRPFVYLLTKATSLLLRLLGLKETGTPNVTEEEIHAMLHEGSEAGVIEKSEHAMVRNVFRLDERQVGSLMVPRSDIEWLDLNQSTRENLEQMVASTHFRFPICRGGLDEILGIASAKHFFQQSLQGQPIDFTSDLEPAVYVPESLNGMDLLTRFRATNTYMVFVVDEYGEVQGLVTVHDLIESVTGEFQSENIEEGWGVQRQDGSWLLDGLIPIVEMKDRLDLQHVPEEEKGRYQTLSGMIMWLLGRLPDCGDIVEWDGWQLEVIDLDGKRIDKVLASRATPPDAPLAPAATDGTPQELAEPTPAGKNKQ